MERCPETLFTTVALCGTQTQYINVFDGGDKGWYLIRKMPRVSVQSGKSEVTRG